MKTRTLSGKLTFSAVVMIVASTVVIGATTYFFHLSSTLDACAQRTLMLAETVSSGLDGDALAHAAQTGEKTDGWQRSKKIVDEVMIDSGMEYLYVLDTAYDTHVRYIMEGYSPIDNDEEEYDLGAEEPLDVFADEMYRTIEDGKAYDTGTYESTGFGYMVSGFAPVFDSNGDVVAVVGVDMSLSEVLHSTVAFVVRTVVMILAACVLCAVLCHRYIRKRIGTPIVRLTESSDRIAKGDLEIDLEGEYQYEIGRLFQSFREMAENTRIQIAALEALADGDLSVTVIPRCQEDAMGYAIQKLLEQLGGILNEIQRSTDQVTIGAQQIAMGAQALADGAQQQAASVEELSSTMTEVAEKTQENAGLAEEASEMAATIRASAEAGTEKTQRLVDAMDAINQANGAIGRVMRIIDDIASQTNILALNAAVEAARAGQHGKGFAIVAGEVRSLAARSAEAAKQTDALVQQSIDRAAQGTEIVADTAQSLEQIISEVGAVCEIIDRIEVSSEQQSLSISEIHQGIGQVAQVVHQNSATSEESAAASEQMQGQAGMLQKMVQRFQLRKNETAVLPSETGMTMSKGA